jgi:hypothetical protein
MRNTEHKSYRLDLTCGRKRAFPVLVVVGMACSLLARFAPQARSERQSHRGVSL